MALRHFLLFAATLLVWVTGVDFGMRAATTGWSQSVGVWFASALLFAVLGHYFAAPKWRGWLMAIAIAFLAVGLVLGDWSFETGYLPGVSF